MLLGHFSIPADPDSPVCLALIRCLLKAAGQRIILQDICGLFGGLLRARLTCCAITGDYIALVLVGSASHNIHTSGYPTKGGISLLDPLQTQEGSMLPKVTAMWAFATGQKSGHGLQFHFSSA